jgi:hypothetical protein
MFSYIYLVVRRIPAVVRKVRSEQGRYTKTVIVTSYCSSILVYICYQAVRFLFCCHTSTSTTSL